MKPVGTIARTSTAISAMANQALQRRDGLDDDDMMLKARPWAPRLQCGDRV